MSLVAIPDIDALEDLWTEKLQDVEGVRSAFSIGQLDELESERIFKVPAAMVMFTGAPTNPPKVLGGPVTQEGTMTWSIFVIADGMRAGRKSREGSTGAHQIAKKILEEILGWDIVEDWTVYLVDVRPYDVGEPSKAVYEVLVAHPFDLIGN